MDPQTGRFVSEDPYEGEIEGPVSLHRYLYAGESPVNLYDPTGQSMLNDFIRLAWRFIPTAFNTALSFGRFAHTEIQWDIWSRYPGVTPEFTLNGGRADLFEAPNFLYEIKPNGGTVSPSKQLDRYLRNNNQYSLGYTEFLGSVSPRLAPGISIDYWWDGPGIILYQGRINRVGVGAIASSVIMAVTLSNIDYLVGAVAAACASPAAAFGF